MEEVNRVQTNQVDMKCPTCGNGYMRPNGIVYMTTPQQFEHKCTNCDHKQPFGVRFPFIQN